MNINQHSRFRLVPGSIAGFFLAFMLAACGGGGDDPSTANTSSGGSTSTTNTSTVLTAPADNLTTGIEQSGNINYLVTTANGTRTVPGTVVYSVPKGTLTLNPGTQDALAITTADDWANVTWTTQYGGAIHATGNAVLMCKATTSEVGVSHNMQPVNNPLDIVKGKTFKFYECDPSLMSYTAVFNADGSVSIDGSPEATADFIAKAFSDAGHTDADGTFKLRLYAHTIDGKTSYHLVEMSSYTSNGNTFNIAGLGRQE